MAYTIYIGFFTVHGFGHLWYVHLRTYPLWIRGGLLYPKPSYVSIYSVDCIIMPFILSGGGGGGHACRTTDVDAAQGLVWPSWLGQPK